MTDFSPETIETLYNQGYVFTRIDKGVMHQTRSVRIDLTQFELSSENRRVLKKTENLTLEKHPLPYAQYSWEIGKLGKDFYESRDADFSANKIKSLATDEDESNFNTIFEYIIDGKGVGYCLAYESKNILHYSYPFYDLSAPKDTGLGMMLKAIEYVQTAGKKYIYLGSLQRPTDTYKLQFKGLEWFDGTKWNTDLEAVKDILKK